MKRKLTIYVNMLGMIFFSLQNNIAQAGWQETLENNISNVIKVTTFNDYDNWEGDQWNDYVDCDINHDGSGVNLPTKNSGQNTEWDRSSYWTSSKPVGHGDVVKSFSQCVDSPDSNFDDKCLVTSYNIKESDVSTYAHYDELGPYGMFYYFGNGDPSDYQEVYIFFRFNIPPNRWPTQEQNGTTDWDTTMGGNPYVKNISGHNYEEISSEKWLGILSSRINGAEYYCFNDADIGCNAGETNGGCKTYRYQIDDLERWIYLYNGSSLPGGINNIYAKFDIFHPSNDEGSHPINDYQNIKINSDGGQVAWNSYLGKTSGMEIRLKVESGDNQGDGIVQVWLYDKNGTATNIIDSTNPQNTEGVDLLHSHQFGSSGNAGINMLYLISNCRIKSSSGDIYYQCGEGMRCNHWWDDIITAKSRIGPTYFSLLSGTSDTTAPSSPIGLTIY